MNLSLTEWKISDGKDFYLYLESQRREEKVLWSKNILQTDKEVLALKTDTIKDIVKEILHGNPTSFMDLKLFKYYESTAIYGVLLTKINDFPTLKKYLSIYLDAMDSWAHVDILGFDLIDQHTKDFIQLSETYLLDDRIYVRRLGVFILFLLVKQQSYLPYILNQLKSLKDEDAYYVIMMSGWLLSECIITYKEDTLSYIKTHDINPKIVNKAIQKCRESRRLTQVEKDELLAYKIKLK